jgi:outer membrane protein
LFDAINLKLLCSAAVLLGSAGAGIPAVAQPEIPDPSGVTVLEVVERMLALDPNIALEATRVEGSRGAWMVEASRFDTLLSSGVTGAKDREPTSEVDSTETDRLNTSFGATRELRSGLSLEPSVTLSRVDDGEGEPVNVGTIAFSLRQPLLRDRGREVVAAGQRSAERRFLAADLDLSHRISERVRAVTSQYWQVVAAWHNLQILRTTEASARAFLDSNRRLVAADARPEAALVLLEADLADKESASLAGEQALFEARRNLALEIGLAPGEMNDLPLPSEPLPDGAGAPVPAQEKAPRFIAAALERRADLQAAQQRLESDRILLRAADNALRPRLDLVLTPSWTGLVEGSELGALLSSGFDHVPGLSSSLGLAFSFPPTNRAARGARVQTAAALKASELTVELFEREIGATVPIALHAVRQSTLQLERAARAAELFERAVVNEEKKLQAGRSTLIDVINQRDRLTAARQTLVAARLDLALALLDLRFETGTLLTPPPTPTGPPAGPEIPLGGYRVRREDLTTVPVLDR